MNPSRKITVVLPTYNEKGHIVGLVEAILKELAGRDVQILVMDDQSPDGTADAIRESFRNDPRVVAVSRTADRGLANSIYDGVKSVESGYVAVMDTDFSHDPSLLPLMIGNLEHFDLVIGSRFIHGGGMYSNFRYSASYLFNLYCRILLGTRVSDHLSGFFAARMSLVREIIEQDQGETIFRGYGDYFIRFVFYAVLKEKKILEIPSWYKDREYGESKTRFLTTLRRYTAAAILLRIARGSAWRSQKKPRNKR